MKKLLIFSLIAVILLSSLVLASPLTLQYCREGWHFYNEGAQVRWVAHINGGNGNVTVLISEDPTFTDCDFTNQTGCLAFKNYTRARTRLKVIGRAEKPTQWYCQICNETNFCINESSSFGQVSGSFDIKSPMNITTPNETIFSSNEATISYMPGIYKDKFWYRLNKDTKVFITENPIIIPALNYSTEYMFRLFANSSYGHKKYKKTIYFTTGAEPPLPPAPTPSGGGGYYSPPKLTIQAPSEVETDFEVEVGNIAAIKISNVKLLLDGIPRAWYTIEPESVQIDSDSTSAFNILLDIPEDAGNRTIEVTAKYGMEEISTTILIILPSEKIIETQSPEELPVETEQTSIVTGMAASAINVTGGTITGLVTAAVGNPIFTVGIGIITMLTMGMAYFYIKGLEHELNEIRKTANRIKNQ